MARPKGSKNKVKKTEEELYYNGYFLMDSGLKIHFDISAIDGGDFFAALNESGEFTLDESETVWLGEEAETPFIRVKKIMGFNINDYRKNG